MAVQQNKKSASKRNMHRSHDSLTNPPLAIEPAAGEIVRRRHVSPYRVLSRQEGHRYQVRRISIDKPRCAQRPVPVLTAVGPVKARMMMDMADDSAPMMQAR